MDSNGATCCPRNIFKWPGERGGAVGESVSGMQDDVELEVQVLVVACFSQFWTSKREKRRILLRIITLGLVFKIPTCLCLSSA